MFDDNALARVRDVSEQIPMGIVDAIKDLPPQDLVTIEREISYYERTGILKGRSLEIMKSLEGQTPKRKSKRPKLLVA